MYLSDGGGRRTTASVLSRANREGDLKPLPGERSLGFVPLYGTDVKTGEEIRRLPPAPWPVRLPAIQRTGANAKAGCSRAWSKCRALRNVQILNPPAPYGAEHSEALIRFRTDPNSA